eukprot:scaffold7601_cov417-Prasinococcus_capsulatus_cf.AAC.11
MPDSGADLHILANQPMQEMMMLHVVAYKLENRDHCRSAHDIPGGLSSLHTSCVVPLDSTGRSANTLPRLGTSSLWGHLLRRGSPALPWRDVLWWPCTPSHPVRPPLAHGTTAYLRDVTAIAKGRLQEQLVLQQFSTAVRLLESCLLVHYPGKVQSFATVIFEKLPPKHCTGRVVITIRRPCNLLLNEGPARRARGPRKPYVVHAILKTQQQSPKLGRDDCVRLSHEAPGRACLPYGRANHPTSTLGLA